VGEIVSTEFGRIHVVEKGAGDPLILLHSNGCSAHEYRAVMDGLAASRRVIAWDMPSHGDSCRPSRFLSIGDFADAVIALMDGLGIERASVSGSSVGGTICVDLGARYASRMETIVLVETPLRSEAEWKENWGSVDVSFGATNQPFERVAPRFRKVTPEFLERWNIDRNKAGAKSMVDTMWALREYDVLAALPRIGCRVAAVYGDRGPMAGMLDRLHARLPNAPVTVLPNCGHFPMVDDPEAFVRTLEICLAADSPSQ
jgi:pimeloyl-ACP methyl ester carboxylesterase